MLGIAKKIFGSSNDRKVKDFMGRVQKINALEDKFAALSDDELRMMTDAFRDRVAGGGSGRLFGPGHLGQAVEKFGVAGQIEGALIRLHGHQFGTGPDRSQRTLWPLLPGARRCQPPLPADRHRHRRHPVPLDAAAAGLAAPARRSSLLETSAPTAAPVPAPAKADWVGVSQAASRAKAGITRSNFFIAWSFDRARGCAHCAVAFGRFRRDNTSVWERFPWW